MSIVEELAAFAADLTFDRLPEDVEAAVRRHLLDTIGCAIASAQANAGSVVVDAVHAWAGAREAGIPGFDFRAPAPQAAMAFGTLVHALDFDDTHVASLVHPGAAVIPAALAAAEEAGADGRSVACAIAAGYEIACRLGLATAGSLHERGIDPTGVCGPYGAAAAAGRIWGLPAETMEHALSLAGAIAGGFIAGTAGSSDVMRLRAGWASQTGVIAADLARRGMTGPGGIVEGPHRLFDAAIAIDGLESRWESARVAIKAYPAAHITHAYADAAAHIGVKPGDIEEIVCFVHPRVIPLVCEPLADKRHPQTDTQARLSLPYTVAAAVIGGRAPMEMFGEDARNDRRILSIAERVGYVADPDAAFPGTFGGRLRVQLRDGRVRNGDEQIVRGHPDRPLSDDELRVKFYSNTRGRLDPAVAQKLADEIRRLPELDDTDELVALSQGL